MPELPPSSTYLEHGWFDSADIPHTVYLFTVEVRQANAFNKSGIHQFFHGLPCVHIVYPFIHIGIKE